MNQKLNIELDEARRARQKALEIEESRNRKKTKPRKQPIEKAEQSLKSRLIAPFILLFSMAISFLVWHLN